MRTAKHKRTRGKQAKQDRRKPRHGPTNYPTYTNANETTPLSLGTPIADTSLLLLHLWMTLVTMNPVKGKADRTNSLIRTQKLLKEIDP